MSKIFFAGQSNFGNRGCEALVRSICQIVSEARPGTTFIAPSSNIELDRKQWPEAERDGLEFVEAAPFPSILRWWNRFRRIVPSLEKIGRPHHTLPARIRDAIKASDIVVMTGGDTISLDYGIAALYDHVGYIDEALAAKKPTMLWAASVGPFSKNPAIEKQMLVHLQQYDFITVRESNTLDYLNSLGLKNVAQVADPAFVLKKQELQKQLDIFNSGRQVVGINLSPLVRGYRPTEESRNIFDSEVCQFILQLANERNYSVLLVPHVGQLNGDAWNNDFIYMRELLAKYNLEGNLNIELAPPLLNAAELKYIISKCHYFIGARTHSTIAALSSGVPTISIAYSVKAKGINKDIFGSNDYVLDTPLVSTKKLVEYFDKLILNEQDIKDRLAAIVPKLQERARNTAHYFNKLVKK